MTEPAASDKPAAVPEPAAAQDSKTSALGADTDTDTATPTEATPQDNQPQDSRPEDFPPQDDATADQWPTAPAGGPDPSVPPGQPDQAFAARYGLVRPLHGRYFAGVCSAVGRATNTDPVLWRVLVAVLSFFGGIGLIAYLLGWLFIPAEGDTGSPAEALMGRGKSTMSPLTAVLVAIVTAGLMAFALSDGFRAAILGTGVILGVAYLISRRGVLGPAVAPGGGPAQMPPYPGMGWPQQQPAPQPQPTSGYPAESTRQAEGARPFAPHGPYASSSPYAQPGGYPTPTTYPTTTYPPVVPYPTGSGSGASWQPPMVPPAGPQPTQPQPAQPRPQRQRHRLGRVTVSLMLIATGLLVIADIGGASVPGSAYVALPLTVLGLGLLTGSWFSRARGLIPLGIVLCCALGIAVAAEDNPVHARGTDYHWAPQSIEAIASDYSADFGNAVLDLRAVDFANREVNLTATADFGKFEIILPPNVDTTVNANMDFGSARVFDARWKGNSGTRRLVDNGTDGPGGGQLDLELHSAFGTLEVHR